MAETLREVAPNLWVSDFESAMTVGDEFALVVDCTGTSDYGNRIPARPTGKTGHTWTVADLERITIKVAARLSAGKTVLVHCRQGRSRSVCAAAAVLLEMGQVETVEEALAQTMLPGSSPASQSVSGLRKWWSARQQPTLF